MRTRYPKVPFKIIKSLIKYEFDFVLSCLESHDEKNILLHRLGKFRINLAQELKIKETISKMEQNKELDRKELHKEATDDKNFMQVGAAVSEGLYLYVTRDKKATVLRDARFEVCKGCKAFTERENVLGYRKYLCDRNKGGCGCDLELKLRLKTEECPLGNWAKVL